MGLVGKGKSVPARNDLFLVTLKRGIVDAYNAEFQADALPGDGRNRWARQLRKHSLRRWLEGVIRGHPANKDIKEIVRILETYGKERLNDRGRQFLDSYASGPVAAETGTDPSPALTASTPASAAAIFTFPAPLQQALTPEIPHPLMQPDILSMDAFLTQPYYDTQFSAAQDVPNQNPDEEHYYNFLGEYNWNQQYWQ
ncbi:hypothetical protein PRK78_005953 [Emydomyces testavorans]|uniref:Uncharacterized protein n=1 Tax=Emydomyces testavorans TaxID=2070801 RepID=A0AAF0DKT3_9EURO|nr:hypothetical protein PRK78_005953 [Emydomyces testavorans]